MSRFIKKLNLRNVLSFDNCEVELQDLNILIGPNGAGKSNLIEAIGLLRSLVYDYPAYLGQGGGLAAWIWKGQKPGTAQVQSTLHGDPAGDLVHSFRVEEGIRWEKLHLVDTATDVFNRVGDQVNMPGSPPLPFEFPESVLRRFRIPSDMGPTGRTGQRIESVRIYREFRTGKNEVLRAGASSSGDGTRLEEGGQNLALVLDDLDSRNRLDQIREVLGEINQGYKKIRHKLIKGVLYVQLDEEGLLDPVLSQRISDGTLKFLCLAALLLDPQPPPLICIEEPEVGLHPDAMRVVARLLREASERTQLIVTTHSVDMINEFTGTPEAVMVTEKNERHATQFTRLDRDKLQAWLERYQLGELWQKGELGGNRW